MQTRRSRGQAGDDAEPKESMEKLNAAMAKLQIEKEELVEKAKRLTKGNKLLEAANTKLVVRAKADKARLERAEAVREKLKDSDRLKQKYYHENQALKENWKANEVKMQGCDFHRRTPPKLKEEKDFIEFKNNFFGE